MTFDGKWIPCRARNDIGGNGFRVKHGMTFDGKWIPYQARNDVGGNGFRVKHGMTLVVIDSVSSTE